MSVTVITWTLIFSHSILFILEKKSSSGRIAETWISAALKMQRGWFNSNSAH